MNVFDVHRKVYYYTIDSLKKLSILNPLTIRKKGTRSKALFALALVCFFWGTTWVASKEGVKYIPDALQLAAIRQFIAGSIYVGFFIYKGAAWPKGKEWIPIVILSFLNFAFSNGFSTLALQYEISAGLGAIIGAIFPLWLVVIGLFSTKEKTPVNAIVGLLIGFGGVCIIFSDRLHDFLNPAFRIGILLSITATWTWAIATHYTKKQVSFFNPYFSLGLQMLISSVVLYSYSSATGNAISILAIPWQAWVVIAFLILFGSLIAFVAYLYALQHLPTEQTSIYAYVNPMVAVLIAWLFFNGEMSVYIVAGGAITMLGVYLVNKAYKKPGAGKTNIIDPAEKQ